MANRTAILVTGSREWTDDVSIRFRLNLYPRGSILLHGSARGADAIAAMATAELGLLNWPLPYFADLGKSGGHARNRALFAVLLTLQTHGFECFVEAFPLGESRGIRGMIALVERHNASDPTRLIAMHVEEGKADG
jgi:hypothetical protein